MFSRRRRKASDTRICTQEGNTLDTIAFACLVRLFMHGSNFLLLLEICQSFQIFQPLLEAVLEAAYIPRHGLSQLQPKTFTNIPRLPLSHIHPCAHTQFWEPTAFLLRLASCPHSPGLLYLLLHPQVSNPFHQIYLAHQHGNRWTVSKEIVWKQTFNRVKRHHKGN